MSLIYESEWVQTTGITQEDAANRARKMLDDYLQSGEVGECDSMPCCETAPMRYRINPDTGKFEQSTNGGATWGAAGGGVQSVIVEPVPPVTSGVAATKCDAASNVKEQVQVWIDQVSNDFTTATTLLEFGIAVLEAILAAVLVVLSLGALTPLEALVLPTLGAALFAAWGAGKTVFDAYWSTENKDIVFCAAYCNIGDDGSFSAAQFSAFWNQVNSELPPSPAKMLFMGFLSSVGKEGLNAMASSGVSADSDCSDCTACIECLDAFTWPTDVFGANSSVIVDTDHNWISADALLIAGNYYWGFRGTKCCSVQVTKTSGDEPNAFKGLIPCPEPETWSFYDESTPPWVPAGLTISGNAFAVMMRSTTPFSARLEFI